MARSPSRISPALLVHSRRLRARSEYPPNSTPPGRTTPGGAPGLASAVSAGHVRRSSASSRCLPSARPLQKSPASYSVIHFQAPNPDALRQEPENERSNLSLEKVAHNNLHWRIFFRDNPQNRSSHHFGAWRSFHIFVYRGPRFVHALLIHRVALASYRVVEVGPNITGLDIDDSHVAASQLDLERHRERNHGRFGGIVSPHERDREKRSQRGHVNDSAAAAGPHLGQGKLHQTDMGKKNYLKLSQDLVLR